MKSFIDPHFLLESEPAILLYEQRAASVPIIDYHNHLSPKDIAEDRKFATVTEAWLEGDHYKWRAMRANGIDEVYITGNATPEAKFSAWGRTVPYTVRNPLYHWTHLELKRYFNVTALLDEASSKQLYHHCNQYLSQKEYGTRGLLKKMNVKIVCTTDDPTDTLEHHRSFSNQHADLKMYPSFRPDKAYAFDVPADYNAYVDRLGASAGVSVTTLNDLFDALEKRVEFFRANGCRSADHGLEFMWFEDVSQTTAAAVFEKIRQGSALGTAEKLALRSFMLLRLCQLYHKAGWVQQFHLGALRNNNLRMFRSIGADTGFDSIGDFTHAQHLGKFLGALDASDQLCKTILYNINPADNEVFATMAGNFNDGTTPGKIQFGSGWWFLDQKDGMERQINTLSSMGLLRRFIGMTTDSRSFLSFPRHEYFRRILCNIIGNDVVNGELPDDMELLGKMVDEICYSNSRKYFGF